ncbi:MAG: YbaK/EbsC family protein [Actinomycetes bacterium]
MTNFVVKSTSEECPSMGLPISGVPPFGHSTQLRVFVDPDLLQYDEVWAAAGTWNDNFGAAPADIVRVAGGVVTDLKRG